MGWFNGKKKTETVFANEEAPRVFDEINTFVNSTRVAIHVRRADKMLLIRPDKTMGINESAMEILCALYHRDERPAEDVLPALAKKLSVDNDRLLKDAQELIYTLGAMLNEDFAPRPMLRFAPFDRHRIGYPTLAEIALTYRCQNRCTFCYAASPYRGDDKDVMTTEQIKKVMHKIFHQAHVPSLSFTGGEATLRADLLELIGYGKELGFRVNLISNGVRSGKYEFAEKLAHAGLDSTQISIEAGDAELHDKIVGRAGAFEKTTNAVRHFQRLGLHVHTNSTLCGDNIQHAPELIRYVARDLKLKVMSMNMLIRTGVALATPRMEISYQDIADHLPKLLEVAEEESIKLVWYSPVPYCIVNPIFLGLGAKSCACIDGILSVDPNGNVLPCSSFGEGIGSLLEKDFDEIYASAPARYWREKKYLPPNCQGCAHSDICGGACPLYWDESGNFAELPPMHGDASAARSKWEAERCLGGSFGVDAPNLGS
jgi:radical SAM protein with 4Fe4S-binding SPASM domain